MISQLHQHLADMAELRQQVEQSIELCDPQSDDKLLFDELAAAIDDHHTQLSECLRELNEPVAV